MLEAAREHFEPVFIEKDDEPELVARYELVYYPAYVWTDGNGEELMRAVQPASVDELLDDLGFARDALTEMSEPGD